jgi:hypothetical protein
MSARQRKPRRFYERALEEAERCELPAALEIEGVDEEIALLRLRLRTALEEHPEDLPLMFRGVELLTRAVTARYRLPKPDDGAALRLRAELLKEVTSIVAAATAGGKGMAGDQQPDVA